MHLRWTVALLCILTFGLAADAHPVPFSYVDLQLHGASIDLTLTVHIFDLAHDLQVTPMERILDSAFLMERESAIRQLLTPRLTLQADGHSVDPQWLQSEILADR